MTQPFVGAPDGAVERLLPKLNVEGSSPFARSIHRLPNWGGIRASSRDWAPRARTDPARPAPPGSCTEMQGSAAKGRWTGPVASTEGLGVEDRVAAERLRGGTHGARRVVAHAARGSATPSRPMRSGPCLRGACRPPPSPPRPSGRAARRRCSASSSARGHCGGRAPWRRADGPRPPTGG